MNVMKLMVVALAGWINQQQEQEDVIDSLRIGRRRGGGLPRAAWGFASLLLPGLPGRGMKSTISISGQYGGVA
jgi:hypothetical protein